jgi:hypothetical protein
VFVMNARLKAAFAAALGVGLVSAASAGVASSPTRIVPANAQALQQVPVTVTGETDGRLAKDAPIPQCAPVAGVNWYTVKAPHRGAMVARLVAYGELDGVLAVYRIIRSQRMPVLCAATNRHGRARVAWYAYNEGSYLLGVARRTNSAAGRYGLTVLAAEHTERAPGAPLPASGIRSTVNPVLDRADAWAVTMVRGVTYRLNLTTASRYARIGYSVYRPDVPSFVHARPVLVQEYGGYADFTPGLDGGGLYSVVVTAQPGDPVNRSYRLEVARAGPDDTAPGVHLANGQAVTGSLFAHGIDAVDMYRFGVPRANQLTTIELRQQANVGFDLLVVNETGGRVAAIRQGRGLQVLRLHIPDGRYYAIVRSRGTNGGPYGLQIRVRDITATTIDANGSPYVESPPATAVPLTVHVNSASHGGRVVIELDHFDPIAGWHFATMLNGTVSASGTYSTGWIPPSVGQFRARARFVANPYSSFSQSGYVHVHVVEPLE